MSHWYNNAVFYHIHPLGFCSAPRENNKNITEYRADKILSWISQMKEMNIDALYLGPVYETASWGDDVRDFMKIDRRLGDNDSFKKICHQLHNNGIKIVLEAAFTRVGREFFAFRDIQDKKSLSAYRGWFQNLNFGAESPYSDGFWYEGFNGHFDLVKLNLRNPQVTEYIFQVISFWIDEFDIDGIAFDNAELIDFDFFKRINWLRKNKKADFWLMGKIEHGDYKRWANPEMLDSIANSECCRSLCRAYSKNCYEIDFAINRQYGPSGLYKDMNLYNSTVPSYLCQAVSDADSLCSLYTLLYTMPGIPSVYYGCEFDSVIDADVTDTPCLDIHDKKLKKGIIFNHIKKLGQIYKAHAELRTGKYSSIITKNKFMVFSKSLGSSTSYVLINTSSNSINISIETDQQNLCEVLNNLPVKYNGSSVTVTVGAGSSAILCRPAGIHDSQTESAKEENTSDILPGEIYRHYKGSLYRVICIAKHSETMEELVVYQALDESQKIWARPKTIFNDTVDSVKRFSLQSK